MAFVIGDYEYTVYSSTNRTVSAKVVDTTKTAYANIPQTVTNDGTEYTVTRLGSCFDGCANMVNPPTIPSTVTYMFSCFDGCSSMVGTPNIPNGVTGSMSYCFRNCASMVNPPNIPNGVTSIIQCFRGCSSMTAPPDLPASITSMGSSSDIHGCFEGCSSLAYAPSIPSGVKYLNYCFSRCTSLVNAPSIPDGVIDMYRTFHECNSLLEAPEIPNSVTDLGCCFWDTAITEPPEIPNSVTDMGYCFAFCENLERAPVIPNGVTDMGKCFTGCNSLTEPPVIPSSVTNIEGCFENCYNLLSAPAIPSGITSMKRCFCYCKSLKTPPAIPNGVENMGLCFYCCYSLESAPEIPQSVTSMEWCFVSCKKLASAPRLPVNVANVEKCFDGCHALSGTLVVMNTPSEYTNLFRKTRNPIYVVPMGGADQTVWKAIADQYANVIFMADANSKPALAFTVTRVSASDATAEDVEGGWAHVVASATAYMDALPDGYTNDVGALTATLNGTAITPTWTQVSRTEEDYKVTLVRETWVQITDARQLFAIYVVDSYSAQSAVITVKLPSTGVMWDVHAGGDGFTIGRRATGPGFAVAMDSDFEGDVDVGGALSFDGEQAYPLFVSSTVPTGSSAYGLSACFVYCTADSGLYHCNGSTVTRLNPEQFPFLGTNPTGGTANDTQAFWKGKGTGYAFFGSTGQLNGQPSQWGFLLNLVYGDEVHQEFWVQSNGAHYRRGGNASTGAMPSWTNCDTNTQTITGVKGNAESSYRTGNVNLTAANIGAQAALSVATHTSGVFTAASGISVTSQTAKVYGKVCQLELLIKHSAAWSVGSQYNVGTVNSGYRPATHAGCVMGTHGVGSVLTSGQVYIRPLFNTETAANSSSYVRATYILP